MMMTLDELFAAKLTENGDISFSTTGNNLLDILFMSEFYSKHLDQVRLGNSLTEKVFSMFMRDPRFGIGRRDLGRVLMECAQVAPEDIVKAGRFDDIYHIFNPEDAAKFFRKEILAGNELAKKWAPRYSSKDLPMARQFAHYWNLNKQQYGKFIKTDTTENKLSRHRTEDIEFEHVPSLALLKYYKRFKNGEDTSGRFAAYLEAVQAGKKDMHVGTSTVYDIYRNRESIDPDLFFEKIEKIAINCIPIVDTSGSMSCDDALGKALSIGHYLSKCSTYAPNKVVEFSEHPHLITLGTPVPTRYSGYQFDPSRYSSTYMKEICSMYTGDCGRTNFGATLDLLSHLGTFPEYFVVLSDMEFDQGSFQSKSTLEKMWKDRGITTKIVWWNLNSRNTTVPEMDKNGNIYISGYSPMLLKYLSAGFDGAKFLDKLLQEYIKNIR